MSKVFISYSHDSEEHRETVLALSERLRKDGIETSLDRYVQGTPAETWPRWMMDQVDWADFVLLVCTETYYRRFRGHEVLGKGKGADWEGAIITQGIYDAKSATIKFVPALFDPIQEPFIPEPVRGRTHYVLNVEDRYQELLDFLLGQAGVEPCPVGVPRTKARTQVAPLTFSRSVAPGQQPQISPSRLSHGAERLFGREAELELLDQAWENPATHILTFVAFGGVGKTSLLIEWMARKAAAGWPGMERVFDWSFYSQGTREQGSPSADIFIKEALIFFGDREMAESPASAWDKGARLAHLVAERPTLLVLDGLEPLQYPPGPMAGRLKDPIIETLLKGLNRQNLGLCIITTRDSLEDLKPYRDTTAPEQKLEFLSEVAGAALLHQSGAQRAGAVTVKDDDIELQNASREVGGHALTLKLLGNYLCLAANGDVRQRAEVRFEEADQEYWAEEARPYGHAFKVMSAYENWFDNDGKDGRRKVAVLRLLGLFDGPADVGCIEALRKPPAIRGLTEDLADQGRAKWQITLKYLARCGLVTIRDNNTLDAHPLIREYFAKQLRDNNLPSWRAGHKRLYEHLTSNTKDKLQPNLDDLQPLYQSVSHGCHAGMQQQVFEQVYWKRILRKGEHYSIRKLGGFGTELGAIACFFERPWSLVFPTLSADAQAWLLAEAAHRLRALGRLTEAVQLMRAGLEMRIGQEKWKESATVAGNLSELELTLGWMSESQKHAEQSLKFADQSGDEFQRISKLTTLADTLHQVANRDKALALFREAEAMQVKQHPTYQFLSSFGGFRYCDLLLDDVERACWKCIELRLHVADITLMRGNTSSAEIGPLSEVIHEVEQRTKQTLEWTEAYAGSSQLDFALHHLTLGRVAFCRAILVDIQVPVLQASREELSIAVDGLRQAGYQHHIPRGLLFRAWLRFVDGDHIGARTDLNAAWEIAERGPMRLHMADIHLHRARLFRDKEELCKARAMIEECGYRRRKEELADAEAASLKW